MMQKTHLETKNVADIVRFHGSHNPKKNALIVNDAAYTYEFFDIQSNKVLQAFNQMNIPAESRVGYLGKESEKYYEILFGCAKANMVLVPINWRLKPEEVLYILKDSETKLLFLDPEFEEYEALLKIDLDQLIKFIYLEKKQNCLMYANWLNAIEAHDTQLVFSNESTFVQMYTSGTIGFPKGVELSHKSFFQIRDSLLKNNLKWLNWNEDDVSLIGIPGFHIGGIWWALQGFSAGLTNVTIPVFHAYEAIRIIKKYRISIACVVPAMISMILVEKNNCEYDFNSLRKVVYGGSPIAESLLQDAIDEFRCEFAQIYGLTETGNTAICLPPEAHINGSKYLLAAGKPYPCVDLKITDVHGATLPPFQIGEVYLRTPARMKGYWNMRNETQKVLIDDWIKTGDAGYVDGEGYLYICDRIKDTIIVAGEKIYPAEVENAINKHDAVKDVAVIGIPDEQWGESVYAFVTLHAGQSLSLKDLHLFLKEKIADFKIPSEFEFVQSIPRNPSGKILRRELRNQFWQEKSRMV